MPDHTSPRPHLVWRAGPPVSAGYLPSGPRAQPVPALRDRWFGRSGPRGPRAQPVLALGARGTL